MPKGLVALSEARIPALFPSSLTGLCVCVCVCAEMGAITALFGHSCRHDLLMRKEIRFSFGIMVKIISRLGHCRVCVQ